MRVRDKKTYITNKPVPLDAVPEATRPRPREIRTDDMRKENEASISYHKTLILAEYTTNQDVISKLDNLVCLNKIDDYVTLRMLQVSPDEMASLTDSMKVHYAVETSGVYVIQDRPNMITVHFKSQQTEGVDEGPSQPAPAPLPASADTAP